MTMRTEDEIIRLHDMLSQIGKGDIPEVHFPDEVSRYQTAGALNALCWVLRHDDATEFDSLMKRLDQFLASRGYVRTPVRDSADGRSGQ